MDKKEEKPSVKASETVAAAPVSKTPVSKVELKPPVKPARKGSIMPIIWFIVFLFFACTFTVFGVFVGTRVIPVVDQWLIDHNFKSGKNLPNKETASPFLPQPTSSANNGAKGSSATTIPQIVKQASPSVVSIAVVNTNPAAKSVAAAADKIGTGFVVDSSGYVITNQHVVSDTTEQYQVVMQDNKTYPVKSVIRDDVNDIALLIIEKGNYPAINLGDSDSLQVGETVIAIGTPLGEFPGSVTVGVISGLKRSVSTGSGFWGIKKTYDSVIQTDAAVNPGNSGGPLINLSGEVVGINFATTGNADNISFALPVNKVKQKLAEYKQYGKFRSAYIGIGYHLVTAQESNMYNIPVGVLVTTVVKGSPAEKAGILKNDVITKINGQTVTSALSDVLAKMNIGQEVTLTVYRADSKGTSQTLTIKVTLADRPAGQ